MEFGDFKEFLENWLEKEIERYETKECEFATVLTVYYKNGGFDNFVLDIYALP